MTMRKATSCAIVLMLLACEDVRYNQGVVETEGDTEVSNQEDTGNQGPTVCSPSPVMGVGTAIRYNVPPRANQVAAIDPEEDRLVVIGGLERSGVYSNTMFAVELSDGAVTPLRQQGLIQDFRVSAPAVWDPLGKRIIVAGGTAGNADLADAIAVKAIDATATIDSLPDLPRPAYAAVAAFDPVGARIIMLNRIDREIVAHALSTPTADAWVALEGSEVLPPNALPVGLAFEPVNQMMVLILSTARDEPYAVWTMPMARQEPWRKAGELPFVPITRPLVWDPSSCGFLIASEGEERCQIELWLMQFPNVTNAPAFTTTPVSTFELPEASYVGGNIYFDLQRDRLILAGGRQCTFQDRYLEVIDVVPLQR